MSHHQWTGGDGRRLHASRVGTGSAVLLLHGWPGLGHDWHLVVPMLSEEADVIVPDLRGFGASYHEPADRHAPPDDFGPRAQAENLLALLDELAVDQVVVAGYDIGARIAQVLAQLAPERVRALILSAPLYDGVGERRFHPARQAEFWHQHFHCTPLPEAILDGRPDMVRPYLRHFYDKWSGPRTTPRDAMIDIVARAYSAPGAFTASIQWYRAAPSTVPGKGQLTEGEPPYQPTFLIWGEQDPVIPVEWSDQAKNYFTLIGLAVLPGIGHFTPLEAPRAWHAAFRHVTRHLRSDRETLSARLRRYR